MENKKTHRALILQGGGALGAYEVGALKSIFNHLIVEDAKSGQRKDRPLFDIVAGSSIGAVNATILVDNVIHPRENVPQDQVWKNALKSLEEFYSKILERGGIFHPMWWIDNVILQNPFFKSFWMGWDNVKKFAFLQSQFFYNLPYTADKQTVKDLFASSDFLSRFYFGFTDTWGDSASSELARKYYSYWFSTFLGSPGVLGPAMIQPDMKFIDPLSFTHLFVRFNNKPLVETMKNFCTIPLKIKTEKHHEHIHPRLLIISVDVEDITTPVVFDSFSKKSNKKQNDEDFSWYSEYGLNSFDDPKFRIDYDGIEMKHIEASMATPIRYDYPKFSVTNLETGKQEDRSFWDGAFLVNTPLRQVMRAYRQYWIDRNIDDIPELEIFIVNLYPSVESGIPSSPDSIQDRQVDITFHDRTKFQIKIDKLRSDYIKLLEDLIPIAKKHDSKSVENILEKTSLYSKKNSSLKDTLLQKRFKIGRVVYVERKEKSEGTIYAKAFDFSPDTIKQLIREGEKAADTAFIQCTQEYNNYCKNQI